MNAKSQKRDDIPPRSNIIAKLSVLEKWAETEIPWARDARGSFVRDRFGERVLDYFPTADIHFANWDGKQNCEATHVLYPELRDLKKTRRRTIPDSHPDLEVRLDKVRDALRSKSKAQLETGNKSSQIEELERSANHWRSLAEKQEGEIVALRERMSTTERKLREVQNAVKSNQAESSRLAADKDAKIASLTELLSKIQPIR